MINNNEKCCSNCLVYTYQNNLPSKIITQREHYWNEVLTICCRTCNYQQHNNFCNSKIYRDKVNDVFVKKLEIKLRHSLGPTEYEKKKDKIREGSIWMKKI